MESPFGAADQSLAALNTRAGAIDRRVGDLTSDLELMIKAELVGRLGNFETWLLS